MNLKTITLRDAAYPYLLKNIFDPPVKFHVWGNLPDFDEHPPIAIIGTRKPTEYGRIAATELATSLSKAGFSIISGLAFGIDSISQKTVIDLKGITVAVLGSGLKNIAPSTHKRLAEEIVEAGGAIISEFDHEMPGLPFNFPIRNRIISGLSLGVVVVEATLDSGSLITARSAMDQGREVFAVPGPIGSLYSAGTHKLIREGAALIESAQDVIDILEPKLPTKWKTKFSGQSFGIGDKERTLLNLLDYEKPLGVDELVEKSRFKPQEVLSSLTMLELSELLQQSQGGYVKCKKNG